MHNDEKISKGFVLPHSWSNSLYWLLIRRSLAKLITLKGPKKCHGFCKHTEVKAKSQCRISFKYFALNRSTFSVQWYTDIGTRNCVPRRSSTGWRSPGYGSVVTTEEGGRIPYSRIPRHPSKGNFSFFRFLPFPEFLHVVVSRTADNHDAFRGISPN